MLKEGEEEGQAWHKMNPLVLRDQEEPQQMSRRKILGLMGENIGQSTEQTDQGAVNVEKRPGLVVPNAKLGFV